ncbi:acetyl-CoA carboxylase, carboxyltransferase subunit beta [Cohnella lubricantis]|uniref:Acetyl-coenzyme A carboxylase carboxyl transferase subunit beta n=1 Tax=Cohnella lubricantis TaxID=2163172 RepID=A0A841T369_9BACL|nr:acetyl-CoA carboxylase, carboxyltransferase subunit beta [Cohnella lubricantis]MBB6676033.1 acetyl-CoA carboxylase carboxyltransferase subunit beta [Cohnella lubricantis]MBP2117954.1 acetyl-CoA carboxylase carboxyl transferase subunit beta [Cohnella lubricantis]
MFKDFFQKKKYAVVPAQSNSNAQAADDRPKREIPEGLMNRCPKCGNIQFTKELEKNMKVCSTCGHHFRLTALERIAMIVDEGTFAEIDANLVSKDPLNFPDYKKRLGQHAAKSGLREAIVTGEGLIGEFPVVIGVMSFDFFAGSMGSVVGEKITRAIELAMEKKLPLLLFSTSGGARMQESILSLMQMAKTSAALAKFQGDGGLFISVMTDPTMGGVSASFASLGDYNLAEPGALIGFAGRIVIEQTIRQKLPDNFQTAEFNMQHGQLDQVVHRKDLKAFLTKLLDMHAVKGERADVR